MKNMYIVQLNKTVSTSFTKPDIYYNRTFQSIYHNIKCVDLCIIYTLYLFYLNNMFSNKNWTKRIQISNKISDSWTISTLLGARSLARIPWPFAASRWKSHWSLAVCGGWYRAPNACQQLCDGWIDRLGKCARWSDVSTRIPTTRWVWSTTTTW